MLVLAAPGLAEPPPLFPLAVKNPCKTRRTPLQPGCLSASRLFPAAGNFVTDFIRLLAPLFPDTPYSPTYFFQACDFFRLGLPDPYTPQFAGEGPSLPISEFYQDLGVTRCFGCLRSTRFPSGKGKLFKNPLTAPLRESCTPKSPSSSHLLRVFSPVAIPTPLRP